MDVMLDSNDLDRLIIEAVQDDKCSSKCKEISECIQKRSTELVTLITKLGPLLTDKDPGQRQKGTRILAEVLQNLSHDFLQDTELMVITNFFCDRLNDFSSVLPPALQGIFAMVQMKNLPKNSPAKIARAMFQHIQCQTLKQEERNTVYSILQTFLQRYADELKPSGPDFVFGVISLIDGERDPRNLMLLFGMLPHFLRTFPLGHLTEEMFEVIACYFPIDFYSSPDDPNAITREALADALLPCLIAVPEFAEFCMPLLLEKLDSQLRVAKLDSLKMLKECCKTFTIEGMEKFLHDVCQSLHRELIPGTDKEVCKETLAAVTQLIKKLSCVPVDERQATFLQTILDKFIKDASRSLQDVQFSSFLPAARMLLAVAQGSPTACRAVILEVAPMLLDQYHKGSDAEGKVVLLRTLTTFLAVCEEQHLTPTSVPELAPLWTNITNMYMGGAYHSEPEIRKEALHGFLVIGKSLDNEIRPQVYDILCKLVKYEESDGVRQEAISCLKEFSKLFPDEVMEKVVFSQLQCSQDPGCGDANDIFLQSRCMEALCEIAVAEPFMTCIVPQILDFVTSIPQVDKCTIGIKCLRKLVELPEAGAKMNSYLYVHCGAVSRLVLWWLHGLLEDKYPAIFHKESLLLDSAKILSTVLRTQSESTQLDAVTEFIPRFLDPGNSFNLLSPAGPFHHTQSVVLLEALLSPVQQGVKIPQIHELMTKLLTLSIQSTHPLTSTTAARLMACLVNKAEDNEHLTILLSNIMATATATLIHNTSTSEALNAVSLFSWVTKALVMRSHREMDNWVAKLVEMLSNEAIGLKAAEGFRLIMVQEEEYMNTENFCNIRFLYRQRFFQIVPKLVECYHKANNNVKSNFLVSLAYLLQGAPKVVVNMSLQELVPLIVESLGQKEETLLISSLETLKELLDSKQPLIEEHITTFLPRFLQLAKYKDSMKVRVTALQCVLQVSNFPTYIILPLKQEALHELTMCLDDPKRIVRRQAVITRSRWFLVGAPGEPAKS